MLIFDLREIGNRMLSIRKRQGMTQADVAERADLSDRNYADIERGNTNMRLETLLKICRALGVTPDSLLTREETTAKQTEALTQSISSLSEKDKTTALSLLNVFIKSLKE